MRAHASWDYDSPGIDICIWLLLFFFDLVFVLLHLSSSFCLKAQSRCKAQHSYLQLCGHRGRGKRVKKESEWRVLGG